MIQMYLGMFGEPLELITKGMLIQEIDPWETSTSRWKKKEKLHKGSYAGKMSLREGSASRKGWCKHLQGRDNEE